MNVRYLSLFSSGVEAVTPAGKLFAVIAALFGAVTVGQFAAPISRNPLHGAVLHFFAGAAATPSSSARPPSARPPTHKAVSKTVSARVIHHLAGPYAHLVMKAARQARVSPRLVAAVVQVENGGDFHGSATRVSSAGAIGVMQLEPATAWDTLRVNPWNVRQNIDGGARYLAMMLRQFDGNVRLALMAYNAGPASIAQGRPPWAAVAYAREVMRDAHA